MWPVSSRFRDVVAGSHQAVVRATLCTTRQFTAAPSGVELPILSGNVRLTATSDIKSTLDLTVPGDYWDALQPYGVEVFCERGINFGDGSKEWVPLGYFRVDEIEQDPAPWGPVKVTGSGREAQLIDSRVVYPYQVQPGTSHRTVFNHLVNGYIAPSLTAAAVYGMYPGTTVPVDFSTAGYDPDTTMVSTGLVAEEGTYDFLAKLVDNRGCVLRFRPTGELAVERRDGAVLAADGIASAAQALLDRVQEEGDIFEDFTWYGAPQSVAIWNETLMEGFAAAHPGAPYEEYRDLLEVWLPTVIDGEVALSPAVWTIRGGPSGTLISARRSVTRDGVYNMVRAVGSDPAAQTGYQLAYIDDPASPLYRLGSFGTIVRYYASPVLKTGESAAAAAATIQSRVSGLPRSLSLFTVPNPALRPLDIIDSHLVGPGQVTERHVIDEVTIPLVDSSAPEIRTRTLNAIQDVVAPDPQDPGYPDPEDPTGPVDPTDPGEDPGTDPGTGNPDPTDGTQAANVFNWGNVIDGDEFEYTGAPNPAKWGLYDGRGHDGNGQRSPSAYSVHDGIMTCHGENKVSGGAAFKRSEYGYRVEVRARVYNTGGGGDRYHPVLILWPSNDDWPGGAEYDFMECDEGTGEFGLFMHLPNHEPYRQDHYSEPLDLTQWHNYACEWNPAAQILRAFVDGRMVYEGRGRVAQAPGPMHLTYQLDDFGGNPRPCNFDAAWVRIYQKPNA